MTFSPRDHAAIPAAVQAELKRLADLAARFADQARGKSLQWFRTPLEILTKLDDSPVTLADREVETLLRQAIGKHCPGHGIWGEEHGRGHMDAEFAWMVDPIDGTRSFISGHPLWGTLLAVLWRGRPCMSLIDIPATQDRWTGLVGEPSRFNGLPCQTSHCHRLEDAVLMSTTPDMFTAAEHSVFERVSTQVRMRRFGGDCYGYGLLASGHIDLVIESELQPYDFMASIPVIEGAGGCISDWQGQRLTLASRGQVVASANPALHAQALAALARAGA